MTRVAAILLLLTAPALAGRPHHRRYRDRPAEPQLERETPAGDGIDDDTADAGETMPIPVPALTPLRCPVAWFVAPLNDPAHIYLMCHPTRVYVQIATDGSNAIVVRQLPRE